MNILLDTHVIIWFLYRSELLPQDIIAQIESSDNTVYLSVASLWEVEIKHNKHPNEMPFSAKDILADSFGDFEILDIKPSHVVALSVLNNIHSDPFDRILMSQAKSENMKLITADKLIAQYGYSYILPFVRN